MNLLSWPTKKRVKHSKPIKTYLTKILFLSNNSFAVDLLCTFFAMRNKRVELVGILL